MSCSLLIRQVFSYTIYCIKYFIDISMNYSYRPFTSYPTRMTEQLDKIISKYEDFNKLMKTVHIITILEDLKSIKAETPKVDNEWIRKLRDEKNIAM